MIENVIIIGIIAVIVGFAARYLIRAKKKGVKCIGCPDGAKCAGRCAGCSGNCCGCADKTNPNSR